jgi:ABC-type sugar transport system permease subunit
VKFYLIDGGHHFGAGDELFPCWSPDGRRIYFVTADIVGGTGSYMMGQRVRDLILLQGDWGDGAALNFLLLAITLIFSWVAYRFAKLNRIEA